jgi:hypothetical protein
MITPEYKSENVSKSKIWFVACMLLVLLRLFSEPEDVGDKFLRNVDELPDYNEAHPKR